MLVLGGPAALLKRCVASVCWPHPSVSACVVLLDKMRIVLLQRRLLLKGDFGGRGGHVGLCACLSKGTDPSCLICCLCCVLARSVLLSVAGTKHVVF